MTKITELLYNPISRSSPAPAPVGATRPIKEIAMKKYWHLWIKYGTGTHYEGIKSWSEICSIYKYHSKENVIVKRAASRDEPEPALDRG